MGNLKIFMKLFSYDTKMKIKTFLNELYRKT